MTSYISKVVEKPESEESGEDEDQEGGKSENEQKDTEGSIPKSDLTEQTVITGEEEERTLFSCRGKLFQFEPAANGQAAKWKERGVGLLKVRYRT